MVTVRAGPGPGGPAAAAAAWQNRDPVPACPARDRSDRVTDRAVPRRVCALRQRPGGTQRAMMSRRPRTVLGGAGTVRSGFGVNPIIDSSVELRNRPTVPRRSSRRDGPGDH
eukprot:764985-Hanusia_phi.AAC.1